MPYKDPAVQLAYQREWARRRRKQRPEVERAYVKKWRVHNPRAVAKHKKRWVVGHQPTVQSHYLASRCRKYRITPHDFERMWMEQSGRCAICEVAMRRHTTGGGPKSDAAAIDHEHHEDGTRGPVRALLCSLCNRKLGIVEQTEWVQKALRYLERFGVRMVGGGSR